MELLFLFAVLGAVFLLPIGLLRPLTRLLRQHPGAKTKGRFMMTDVFALMFLIPLPVGILRFLVGELESTAMATGMMSGAVLWYAGLHALNHIGVDRQLKRIVGIGFTFPFALISGGCAAMCIGSWAQVISLDAIPSTAWGSLLLSIFVSGCTWFSAKWVAHDCSFLRELENDHSSEIEQANQFAS